VRAAAESAIQYQELNDILDAGPEPFRLHRYMKRLETLRRLVPQLRQEVRQDATVCTDLDV
jgi:hypothetical protein